MATRHSQRLRRAVAAVVAAGCAILTLASCTHSAAQTPSGDGQGFISGGGTVTTINPDNRVAAPTVEGTTLAGDHVALSDFSGQVVVLNVWGSWCAPCRAEAPALEQVAKESDKDGVAFLGINTRDQDALAKGFERGFGVSYPSLVDPDGQLQLQFNSTLPPSAIPSTLIIDRDGNMAVRILGETTYSQLSRLVAGVAAEGQ